MSPLPGTAEDYIAYRWYETQTGRYTSADPLGVGGSSRKGPNLLYAYAAGNPLSFIDRLGLWTTSGCTKAQAAVIGGAINRAKQSIDSPRNPCGLCQDDQGSLKKNIDDSTYFCADNNDFALAFHRMSPGDCGSVYNAQGQKDGFSIALAFDTPPGLPPSPPGGCKCLAGTILHEASHNALGTGDYTNDNNAYDLERKCNGNGDFGCTP